MELNRKENVTSLFFGYANCSST